MSDLLESTPELGFGCMRLPVRDRGNGASLQGEDIDIDQMAAMVDAFLAAGLSYFDTARGYHEGASEGALKKTLVNRYPRDSYVLASKLPAFLAPNVRTAHAMFDISLEDTQAGFFDYFLLHNLGARRTSLFEEYGIWDFLAEKKKQGLIGKLGFSFHDSAEALKRIFSEHPTVDFVQLQINYADWEQREVQSRKCYEVARSFDIPIIVMEPLKGGLLADPPPTVRSLFEDVAPEQSPVSWALRFAASLKGVTTVLSGMSSLEQVEQNVRIMGGPISLSIRESEVLVRARKELENLSVLPCTACGYCHDVCPQHVRISTALTSLNVFYLYDDLIRAREHYLWVGNEKASSCIGCGACEEVCPQHIAIVEVLQKVTRIIEGMEGCPTR